MRLGRKSTMAICLGAFGIFMAGFSGVASAHGSMESPVSRVYSCYLDGPEAPQSESCKAAVAASGTQAFYDWTEVNIADAAGRHREIIPDGKLCSAGRDKYKGLDLPRDDWKATPVSAGADFTFKYKATAPHKGGFQLYVTNDTYDPAQPLKWSNLESEPFLTVNDPAVSDGAYTLSGKLPEGKIGRHLIYAIWQRTDSPEAFYSCSDVVFGGSSATGSAGGTTTTDDTAAPAAGTPGTSGTTGGHDGHAGHSGHQGHTAPAAPTGGISLDGVLASIGSTLAACFS